MKGKSLIEWILVLYFTKLYTGDKIAHKKRGKGSWDTEMTGSLFSSEKSTLQNEKTHSYMVCSPSWSDKENMQKLIMDLIRPGRYQKWSLPSATSHWFSFLHLLFLLLLSFSLSAPCSCALFRSFSFAAFRFLPEECALPFPAVRSLRGSGVSSASSSCQLHNNSWPPVSCHTGSPAPGSKWLKVTVPFEPPFRPRRTGSGRIMVPRMLRSGSSPNMVLAFVSVEKAIENADRICYRKNRIWNH